jgi:hypothetical protein
MKVLTKIFHYLAIALFGLLLYYGLGVTGMERPETDYGNEFMRLRTDSVLYNLLQLSITVGVLFLVGLVHEKFLSKLNRNIFLGIACVFAFAFSVYWVTAAPNGPMADQMLVSQYATAFNQGDFRGFDTPTYVTRYPQQIGLITFFRLIFAIFGNMNYRAIQYVTACLVPLLILSGCMIVRHVTEENRKAEFYYLLMALCFFPMYGYVPFVYGDLSSTAVAMFAAWMLLSCLKKFSYPKMVLMGLASGFMIQLRQNTLIVLIAFAIVLAIKLISCFKKQVILTACGLLAGVLLVQGSVDLLYMNKKNPEIDSIPSFVFVVMGLNDDGGRSGWHNNYEYVVFAENGDNVEASMAIAKQDFKTIMSVFKANPEYAADFFRRKMNAQWNAPMYMFRTMNHNFDGPLDRLANTIYNNGRLGVLMEKAMKMEQLFVYGGILLLLLMTRKKEYPIEKYVLLIAVFGGFLFSMMWEAKTRYIFPYFLMLIPYGAIAASAFYVKIEEKTKSFLQRKKSLDK